MKKLLSAMFVTLLMVGCGEDESLDQEATDKANEREVATVIPKAPIVVEEDLESTNVFGNIASVEPAPRVVINVKESGDSPNYYIKGKKIPLEQIRKLVIKSPEKGTIEQPGRVFIRPDSTICFFQLQEVWRAVASSGKCEIGFDFSKIYGQGKETVIPFLSRPSKVKPLPRLEVVINEFSEILVNGALVEDGNDKEMKELTLMLKNQRELRDNLIQSGSKTKRQAELIVEIKCNPLTEYQTLAGVFNACMNADIEHFYPPDFGPFNFQKQIAVKKRKVHLMKKRERTPSPNAP